MRLYAFQPKGRGELSFFVIADNEEHARMLVWSEICRRSALPGEWDDPEFFPAHYADGFGTPYYTVAAVEPGQVITNRNDAA